MSIRTSKMRVAPLRGMDQRWQVNPTSASKIVDMTWSDQDSWVRAGGFNYIVRDVTEEDFQDDLFYEAKEPVFDTITEKFEKGDETNAISGLTPAFSQDKIEGVFITPADSVFVPNPSNALPINLNTVSFTSSPINDPFRNTASRVATNAYKVEDDPISIHWFAQHNGAMQWLVYETSEGRLRHFNGSRAPQAPWSDIYHIDGKAINSQNYKRKVVTTPWEGTQFATFAARLYMVNGFNQPLVFDGRKASPIGFSNAADQPTVSYVSTDDVHLIRKTQLNGVGYPSDTSDGNEHTSTYRYRVSFVNERGQESALSSPRQVTFTAEQGQIKGTPVNCTCLISVDIPKGPVGTVARRIYRTQNVRDTSGNLRTKTFSSEFFFHSEIQDNITESILDSKPDSSLGSLVDELDFGNFPQQASMIAMFKGRSFVAGNSDNIVRYSRPNFPEMFPEDNQLDLSDTTGSRITALYATKNSLVAFKDRGIYLIKGDSTDGFFAQTLTKDTGCLAPSSIREVPGLGLMFLAADGIYVLEGALENTGTRTAVVKMSTPIRELIRDINFSAVENCRSVIYHRDREYWLSVPVIGSDKATRVLKFSYEIGAWSYMDNMPIKDMTESEDHRGYLFFVANDTSLSGIHVYNRGYLNKAGTALQTEYETADIPFGSVYENFVPVRVQGRIIGYGNNDLEMNFTTNRELTQAYETNKTTQQKRPLEDKNISVYGTTAWGDGSVYAQHRPVYARFDINTMHKGPVNEVKISFTPTSGRIELLEFQMEARIGSRRDVINLTSKMGGTETR